MRARPAAIVWTPDRVRQLPISHIMGLGPEYVAAVTAMITLLLRHLADERDRRLRRRGRKRTRRGDRRYRDR